MLTRKFFFYTAIFSASYLIISLYFTNPSILNQTLFGNFPIEYKSKLVLALLEGLTTAMSPVNLYLLITVSFLTGANLYLVVRMLKQQALQKANFIFGIGSIFGLASSGCASCGLPILGLLGLSSSAAFLPFKGIEISILSVILLLGSFIYLAKKSTQSCRIKS